MIKFGNGQRSCKEDLELLAGIDEAGRGPLAGPVVAAAVILDPCHTIAGLADSKTLSPVRRAQLEAEIQQHAIAWSVAWADSAEIDALNILQATMLAMRRAVLGLCVVPSAVEVDGNRLPNLVFGDSALPGRAIVGGDACIPAISAASIIAKEQRDRMMVELDRMYPEYGFGQHKGYGTAVHRDKINSLGPCPQHRRSFRPLADMVIA